jgi:hypothetical protein
MVMRKSRSADRPIQNRSPSPRRAGDRRLGVDRRWFSYDAHIPERRSKVERRSGRDRRLMTDVLFCYGGIPAKGVLSSKVRRPSASHINALGRKVLSHGR